MSQSIKQEAIEAVAKFGNKERFWFEIKEGKRKTEEFIKAELSWTKGSRNVEYLLAYLKVRKYYKAVLRLQK